MTISNRFNIPLVGDGKLLIGSAGVATPTAANLTAGTDISITNGPGSISIANTGSTSKVKYYASTTPNTTISSSGNLVTLTLPANTANVDGDLIEIGGEIVATQTSGTFKGSVNTVVGSTTLVFYNNFSLAEGLSGTYSFYGSIIRTSSSAAFSHNQCIGAKIDGTSQADAHVSTVVSIDFTNSATLRTSFVKNLNSGTVTQRMLWIRVTGA